MWLQTEAPSRKDMKHLLSSRATLPITAAITLASASFSGAVRGDPGVALTEAPGAPRTATPRTYPAGTLSNLLSFVETLKKNQDFMPDALNRSAVFAELRKDGTMAATSLSQLEQRILLIAADVGLDTVFRGIVRAHADIRNDEIEDEAIFKRISSAQLAPKERPHSVPISEYGNGLRLLHLLTGISHLAHDPATRKETLKYLAKVPPSHATLLATLVGAGQMQSKLPPTARSSALTAKFVETARLSLTDEDRRALKQLPPSCFQADNRLGVATVVTSLTGAMWILYRRIRINAEAAENSPTSSPVSASKSPKA